MWAFAAPAAQCRPPHIGSSSHHLTEQGPGIVVVVEGTIFPTRLYDDESRNGRAFVEMPQLWIRGGRGSHHPRLAATLPLSLSPFPYTPHISISHPSPTPRYFLARPAHWFPQSSRAPSFAKFRHPPCGTSLVHPSAQTFFAFFYFPHRFRAARVCPRSRGRLTFHFSSHFLTSPRQTRPTVLTHQAIPSTRFRLCLFLFPLPPHSRFCTPPHTHTPQLHRHQISSSTAGHRLHSFRRRLDLTGLHLLRNSNRSSHNKDKSTTFLQLRSIVVEPPVLEAS